jgi:hypothetical protein
MNNFIKRMDYFSNLLKNMLFIYKTINETYTIMGTETPNNPMH